VGRALALLEDVDGADRAWPLAEDDGDARDDLSQERVDGNQGDAGGRSLRGWTQLGPERLARAEVTVGA
jgi:hypothetical protein